MNNEKREYINEVIAIAEAIIEERIDLIEGSRKLSEIRHWVSESENPLFHVFIAVSSETDDIPFREARSRFSKDYLEKIDMEVKLYLDEVRPQVIRGCKSLISYFSTKSENSS